MATPVQIDLTNGGRWAQGYANDTQGPFLTATGLYALLSTFSDLEVFKSLDGGVTWTQQDAANEPSGDLNGGTCFFSGTTLWVCYSFSGSGPAPMLVATFDTLTDTWTTGLGTGPVVGVVSACILRTDGTLFIASAGGTALSGLDFDIFDTLTSTFTASGDLGADILTNPLYSASVSAFNPTFAGDNGPYAPANTIWFGFMTLDSSLDSPMLNGVYFAGFTLANATLNFFTVPNQIGNPLPHPQALRCGNGPFMGPPAVCGPGIVVFGVAQTTPGNGNYASLYVTTDFGVTWTLDTAPKGIDSSVTISFFDNAQFSPMTVFDGTKLYMIYAQFHNFISPSSVMRICIGTPDFAQPPNTWPFNAQDAATIADFGLTPGTDGFSFPKYTIQSGHTLISTDINTFGNLAAWFIPFALGSSPAEIIGSYVGFVTPGRFGGGTK